MAAGGLPWLELEDPPADGALDVPGGHRPTHVANRGYTTGVGLNRPGTHTQINHRHPGHMTTGDTMESGGDAHRHFYIGQSPVL